MRNVGKAGIGFGLVGCLVPIFNLLLGIAFVTGSVFGVIWVLRYFGIM